jgi:Na+-transporting NADH:ubiquinone oxidoreductase subunit C
MSDGLKSLLFAAVLCIVCSLLLTTASIGLQGFQEKNVIADKRKNILKSVGLIEENLKYSQAAIEKLYNTRIKPIWVDPNGRLIDQKDRGRQDLPLYLYTKNGEIQAYIVPINSKGLWGRIRGYLALENDGSTAVGFTVYKHSETPGLGGEIEKQWFQKNWIGKKIVNRDGDFVSIAIAKGAVAQAVPREMQPNYVDGISGATLTGTYLSAGIREILENYEPVSIKFRKNLISKPSDVELK